MPSQSHSPSGIDSQPQSYTEPGPSQIPHSSITASPPHSPVQSCTQSFSGLSSHMPHSSLYPVPPHSPHSSNTLPSQSQSPSGIDSQPQSYTEPGPSQIPHSSITASPPHSPVQSCTQSFSGLSSHMPHSSLYPVPPHSPHSSNTLPSQSQSPSGIDSQPQSYTEPGPSQIPHSSITASPPNSPKQSENTFKLLILYIALFSQTSLVVAKAL